MTPVRAFAALRNLVGARPALRLAVAGGEEAEVAAAIRALLAEGLIRSAVIAGDTVAMAPLYRGIPADVVHLRPAADPAVAAVAAVRDGAADILMKGRIDTPALLRAVLARGSGLRQGRVLSNVTVADMPSMPRLLALTDNGILPRPDLKQKREIVANTRALFQGLGIHPVRVAAIAASEKVSPALPATIDARDLASESADGAHPGFNIDGPMGYDVAVSTEAAQVKGLEEMPAAGSADLLLFGDIEAANAVAKSWKLHGAAETGSIVLGAVAPILLNSRSDSAERRVNSLLLAAAALAGADRIAADTGQDVVA